MPDEICAQEKCICEECLFRTDTEKGCSCLIWGGWCEGGTDNPNDVCESRGDKGAFILPFSVTVCAHQAEWIRDRNRCPESEYDLPPSLWHECPQCGHRATAKLDPPDE